ncbi:ABC transporter substrate-binding protein [Ancylobacter terrae]|uniref:ABC transporter substrate-binding protein n=1 Tax=Ancylobacter sp. sgz301288 TaxID=3342077 RepID=UPI00385DAD92
MKGWIAAGALALAASTLAAPAAAQVPAFYPADYAKIVDAAKKEGRLIIYSTTDAASAQPLLADFKALYPEITVDYNDLSSAELYNRIISEKAAGQPSADFAWTSGMDTGVRLAADGFAATYASPEIPKLPQWAVWKNAAYGTTFEPLVFMYNKRLIPEGSVPQSHAELVKVVQEKPDVFKGRVTTYDPSRTLGLMLNVYDSVNNPKFFDDLRALGAAGMRIDASSGSMMEKVGSGEYVLAWNVIGSYVPPRMAKNPAIGMVYPKDYTLVLSRIAFVSETAKNPNAARLFLDYLLSQRGQEIIAGKANLYSLRDDVKGANTASAVKEQIGASVIRPIPIGQDMLDRVMDTDKRVAFLKEFQEALRAK